MPTQAEVDVAINQEITDIIHMLGAKIKPRKTTAIYYCDRHSGVTPKKFKEALINGGFDTACAPATDDSYGGEICRAKVGTNDFTEEFVRANPVAAYMPQPVEN